MKFDTVAYYLNQELTDRYQWPFTCKVLPVYEKYFKKPHKAPKKFYLVGDNHSAAQCIHGNGKYPAIRFGDMQCYSGNTAAEQKEIIRACERWAKQGGIVGLMWHWDAPSGISSVYADETDFSLADAVPESTLTENAVSYQTDVAMLSEDEIQTALENKQISSECNPPRY